MEVFQIVSYRFQSRLLQICYFMGIGSRTVEVIFIHLDQLISFLLQKSKCKKKAIDVARNWTVRMSCDHIRK